MFQMIHSRTTETQKRVRIFKLQYSNPIYSIQVKMTLKDLITISYLSTDHNTKERIPSNSLKDTTTFENSLSYFVELTNSPEIEIFRLKFLSRIKCDMYQSRSRIHHQTSTSANRNYSNFNTNCTHLYC